MRRLMLFTAADQLLDAGGGVRVEVNRRTIRRVIRPNQIPAHPK